MVTTLVTANYKEKRPSATCGACRLARLPNHLLGTNLPISLNVPVAQCGHRRRDCLREVEVSVFQETERKLVVLADRYQCNIGIEGLQMADG